MPHLLILIPDILFINFLKKVFAFQKVQRLGAPLTVYRNSKSGF